MSYTSTDYIETLNRVPELYIKLVIAAWGIDGDMGEWKGGFLCEVFGDKSFVYITGWCDTSGWGCQDGVDAVFYDTRPSLESLHSPLSDWDCEPADLNLYVTNQMLNKI